MNAPLRVIKVGGSLFELADLGDRLQSFLGEQSASRSLLIAGGGPLVNEVRRLDRIHPIAESVAHWICIDLMSITGRLLAQQLSRNLVSSFDSLLEPETPNSVVFDPSAWLREVEPHTDGMPLPVGWEVTSDSIAARLATVLSADELVVLKSKLPQNKDLLKMADDGYVDQAFPKFADALPAIRFVDLRESKSLRVR